MEAPVRFHTSIQLPSGVLEDLGIAFEDTLLDRLRATHEGRCTRFGYIRPGSLQIIKRSAGQFVKQHFNGYIRFQLLCKAKICNPPKGAVVEAVVRNKNALGIHAESMIGDIPVLDIIVPKKSAGIQSDIPLDGLQVGDQVFVEVLGKKYQLDDAKINIIGRCVNKPGGAAASTAAAATAATAAGLQASNLAEEEGELDLESDSHIETEDETNDVEEDTDEEEDEDQGDDNEDEESEMDGGEKGVNMEGGKPAANPNADDGDDADDGEDADDYEESDDYDESDGGSGSESDGGSDGDADFFA